MTIVVCDQLHQGRGMEGAFELVTMFASPVYADCRKGIEVGGPESVAGQGSPVTLH